MTAKTFFYFPEALLLPAIVLTGILGHTPAQDLHIWDTYFVFGKSPFNGFIMYAPLLLLVLISWVVHIVLRAKKRPMWMAREVHIWMTLACLALMLSAMRFHYEFYSSPRRYIDYNELGREDFPLKVWKGVMLLCVVEQVAFWILVASKSNSDRVIERPRF